MPDKFRIGDKASSKKIFTDKDVSDFAKLSGDINPIHLDDAFARQTILGKRIVHGIFVSSLFSKLLANDLPGPGTIYLNQNIKFLKPVFLNEEVTAFVEVDKIREDKPIMTLKTYCVNSTGEVVIDGEAVVKYSVQ